MCLCNGAGGIKQVHSWGITYHPCPDSNCEFDREQASRDLERIEQEHYAAIEMQMEGVKHA